MARRQRGSVGARPVEALLLDADGLSKAARNPVVRTYILAARRLDVPIYVSAATLAETLRGSQRDAPVHLVLRGCQVEPVSAGVGRAAGELLGAVGGRNAMDAIVATTAAALAPTRVRLLTSDPVDLRALTAGMSHVVVEPV